MGAKAGTNKAMQAQGAQQAPAAPAPACTGTGPRSRAVGR